MSAVKHMKVSEVCEVSKEDFWKVSMLVQN